MAYDFEKDKSAKSFQMELDNEKIMTAFITTDEEADGELPELDTGVYGGIGYGPMGPDFEFLNSGGGGSSDFSMATVTVDGAGAIAGNCANIKDGMLLPTVLKPPIENSFTVVLYKGMTVFEPFEQSADFTIPEGETNIYYDDEEGWYVITGDCDITITTV